MKSFLVALCLILFSSAVLFGQAGPQPILTPPSRIIELPSNMRYEEFLKLRRELDWKKVFEAAAVPGYLHFYAQHTKTAWGIATVRGVGYVTLGYGLVDQLNHWDEPGGWFSANAALNTRSKRNMYLFLGGFAVNMLGFAFDWAHGDYIIELERNSVLYKYGIQKKWQPRLSLLYSPDRQSGTIGLTLIF